MSQPARQENAAQGPGFPSYRVHLAQIHYPEAKGLDQEGKVTSFAAPAPSIQKTAKSEAARLRAAGEPAHLIRAVAVVDQTGRILSARAVSEDADARTRDFLAGLAGARVDLPALVEAKDGEIEDRPAEGAAARAGTPASIRTSEILLEIVLDTPDPPAPR
jgi:hypothetical protein